MEALVKLSGLGCPTNSVGQGYACNRCAIVAVSSFNFSLSLWDTVMFLNFWTCQANPKDTKNNRIKNLLPLNGHYDLK